MYSIPTINYEKYESVSDEEFLDDDEDDLNYDDEEFSIKDIQKSNKPQNQSKSLLGDFSLFLDIYINDDEDENDSVVNDINNLKCKALLTGCQVQDFNEEEVDSFATAG